MVVRYTAMATEVAQRYWEQGMDDDGNAVEVAVSNGKGVPCRHCLEDVGDGEEYVILAHRPFPQKGAYSEMGPIFLHRQPCKRFPDSAEPPAMFAKRASFLIRAYDHGHRIVYGSGGTIASANITPSAEELLNREDVAYVHLRSGGYNCFQCRIERAMDATV